MALSIKAEEVFEVGGLVFTNSLLSFSILGIILVILFAYLGNRLRIHPRSKFQLFLEWMVVGLYNICKDITGTKIAKQLFPLIFTFFVTIIISNWFGLLPFVGSFGEVHKAKEEGSSILLIGEEIKFTTEKELVPLFRSPSADLNFTFVLALISFITVQYYGLRYAGFGYLAKFFDYRVKILKGWMIVLTPLSFLINFFWKILELILEFTKILTLSLRLFGNIFAGEVLLFTITAMTIGLLTLPFIGFEIFVGFIQAIIFSFLTMVFVKVSVEAHH